MSINPLSSPPIIYAILSIAGAEIAGGRKEGKAYLKKRCGNIMHIEVRRISQILGMIEIRYAATIFDHKRIQREVGAIEHLNPHIIEIADPIPIHETAIISDITITGSAAPIGIDGVEEIITDAIDRELTGITIHFDSSAILDEPIFRAQVITHAANSEAASIAHQIVRSLANIHGWKIDIEPIKKNGKIGTNIASSISPWIMNGGRIPRPAFRRAKDI